MADEIADIDKEGIHKALNQLMKACGFEGKGAAKTYLSSSLRLSEVSKASGVLS